MWQAYSPEGERIAGTSETVVRTCYVLGWQKPGTDPIWSDDDEVFWDTSTQEVMEGGPHVGSGVVVDENGHQWAQAQCIWQDDECTGPTPDEIEAAYAENITRGEQIEAFIAKLAGWDEDTDVMCGNAWMDDEGVVHYPEGE